MPAIDLSTQAHGAGDAWSRSVGQMLAALAVVGLLFVGALLLLYFGTVTPRSGPELDAARTAAPAAAPVAPKLPAAEAPVGSSVAQRPETPARADSPARDAPRPNGAVAASAKHAVSPPAPAPRATPQTSAPRPHAPDGPKRDESAPVQSAAAPDARVASAQIGANAVDAPASVAAAPMQVAATTPIAVPVAPAPAADPVSKPAAPVPAPPPVAEARGDGEDPAAPVALRPISRPQPQFPRQALQQGITRGRVVARIAVATDGRVSAVTIVSADPPQLFDRAAQSALGQWRFEPIPRPTSAQVELAFRAE